MKNIYIVGVPRSGKSTLTKLLQEKLSGYSFVSQDAFRNAFDKTQPELWMGYKKSDARKTILPQFIFEFVLWNNIILKTPMIIEGALIQTELFADAISKEDLFIVLGHGGISKEEILVNIDKFDTVDDWTYKFKSEEKQKHPAFDNITNEDIKNMQFCKDNKYLYFDTSKNRPFVLEKIIEYIKEQINQF